MKFRVKESEAKPDPEPIESNASLAVLLGTLAWLLGLIAILLLNLSSSARRSDQGTQSGATMDSLPGSKTTSETVGSAFLAWKTTTFHSQPTYSFMFA